MKLTGKVKHIKLRGKTYTYFVSPLSSLYCILPYRNNVFTAAAKEYFVAICHLTIQIGFPPNTVFPVISKMIDLPCFRESIAMRMSSNL